MWGYQRNPDWGFEFVVAPLAVLIAVVVTAVIVTIFIALLRELARIFMVRGSQSTSTARGLWIALAAACGLWVLAAVLATIPALVGAALTLAAWTFLGLVIFAECCDVYESQHEGRRFERAGDLDTYLV